MLLPRPPLVEAARQEGQHQEGRPLSSPPLGAAPSRMKEFRRLNRPPPARQQPGKLECQLKLFLRALAVLEDAGPPGEALEPALTLRTLVALEERTTETDAQVLGIFSAAFENKKKTQTDSFLIKTFF